jgi:hypothetical protein
MAFPLAAAVFATQAAGATIQWLGQREAAKAENKARMQTGKMQQDYFYEVQRYQNDTWKQDLDYADEVLKYSQDEFAKQKQWVETANAAVEKNRNSDAFTLMVRGIEETIAATFQTTGVQRQGQAARAKIAATERGVEGNSTEAVLGEIFRQEGEANTMTALNRENTLRQLEREGIAMDAASDQQMFQIASSMRTFAPNPKVRSPQPLNPVAPTQMVNGPNAGQLISGIMGAGMSGVSTYNAASGQNSKQTYDQFSSWASRQFTL